MSFIDKKRVLGLFRSGNVIVAGHKGSGKDMLFSWVIRQREKAGERHASNIKYTEKTHVRPISFYSCDNTRKNFIANDFKHELKRFVEHEDYYISEAGLSLPSWDFKALEKEYPTFPIVYGLSRHLGEFNIHANAQAFGRIWDKLREQADYYIWCERCTVIFKRIVIQRFVIYNRSETAMQHIQPFTVRRSFLGFRNKKDLEYAQQFDARYGLIKRVKMIHFLPKNDFIYDTRYFHKALFGEQAPNIKQAIKNRKKALKTK